MDDSHLCMITARLCGLCPFSWQSPESAYNTCTCLYSAWTGTLNFCLEQGKRQKGSWPLSAVFTFCFNNSSELNKSEPSSVKNPSASRLFLFSHTLGHTRSFCAWPNFIHLLHHLQVLAPLSHFMVLIQLICCFLWPSFLFTSPIFI